MRHTQLQCIVPHYSYQNLPGDSHVSKGRGMSSMYAHPRHQIHKKYTFQFEYFLMIFEYIGAALHDMVCCAKGNTPPLRPPPPPMGGTRIYAERICCAPGRIQRGR